MSGPAPRSADCSRCPALCCVGPAFAASADFALDKPAGTPCPHLGADHGCGIHAHLRGADVRGARLAGALLLTVPQPRAGRRHHDHPGAPRAATHWTPVASGR